MSRKREILSDTKQVAINGPFAAWSRCSITVRRFDFLGDGEAQIPECATYLLHYPGHKRPVRPEGGWLVNLLCLCCVV